jgi:hypothetical protein
MVSIFDALMQSHGSVEGFRETGPIVVVTSAGEITCHVAWFDQKDGVWKGIIKYKNVKGEIKHAGITFFDVVAVVGLDIPFDESIKVPEKEFDAEVN